MTAYKDDIHPLCYTIAGCSSGIITRAVGQPLDVLKIRFQLQNYEGGALKYTGILSATKNLFHSEGLTAFWKGHVPAQGLSIVYGVVKFNTYELMRKSLYSSSPHRSDESLRWRTAIDFMCGCVAGTTTTFACQPFDVIRTRLVAQENRTYRGTTHAIKMMFAENGVRTFYKGMVPALTMICPTVGFHFAFYGFFKHAWIVVTGEKAHSKTCLLVSGAASGLCSKLILLPLDNVKKRLQVVGFHDKPTYTGMLNCFAEVSRKQGVRALYRGAAPSLLKAFVVTGISFFAYEQVLDQCYKLQMERRWPFGDVT